jgi:hypothetical protein
VGRNGFVSDAHVGLCGRDGQCCQCNTDRTNCQEPKYLDYRNLLFLTVGNGPQCTPHLAVRNTVKGFASEVQRLGYAIRTPPKIPRYSSPFSVVLGLVNVTGVESGGPCAENKTVTGTIFMRFRGPGALDDSQHDRTPVTTKNEKRL